jgi:hypothetical protein
MTTRRVVALALMLAVVSAPVLADTKATFTLPSGVKVKIIEAPFDKKLFKISGCTESSATCFINGHVPFGFDGGLPGTYVKTISVSYRNQSYSLDASHMYNAWGSRPLEYKGFVRYFGGKCFNTKHCQFRGLFSDGAGSFVAEWQVINGLPTRTVLSDQYDIMDLFTRHIDPPEYGE